MRMMWPIVCVNWERLTRESQRSPSRVNRAAASLSVRVGLFGEGYYFCGKPSLFSLICLDNCALFRYESTGK